MLNMTDNKNGLMEIMEYEVFDEEIKNQLLSEPKLHKASKQWIQKRVGNSYLNAVKACYIEYIDYDNIDIDEMDEFEQKDFFRKCKKNEKECPMHRSCFMYQNKLLKKGMKCPLEMAEVENKMYLLGKELDIKPEEINDQIMLSQLAAVDLIYNRSVSGLSNTPLIEEVKKVGKDGVTYDTKINENFHIMKQSVNIMDQLRKGLLLNRDDKQKIKKIDEAKSIHEVKMEVIDIIKEKENDFDINEIINDVTSETKVIEDIDA